jgi:hypothetical protein
MPHNTPIDKLGLLLAGEGFLFAMDLQSTLKSALRGMGDKTDPDATQLELMNRLCTSLEIRALVSLTAKTIRLYLLSRRTHTHTHTHSIPESRVGRFRVELQVSIYLYVYICMY